jgi:hypothetical protein
MKNRALPVPAPSPPPSKQELRKLIEEVGAKVPGALGDLYRLALAHPAAVVKATHADLVSLATEILVGTMTKDDGALYEGIQARLRMLITELSGDAPSPVRKLCVEAVAYAWCDHWNVSTLVAANPHHALAPEWVRRQQAAHRRLMTSLRTLAQIAAVEKPKSKSPFDKWPNG